MFNVVFLRTKTSREGIWSVGLRSCSPASRLLEFGNCAYGFGSLVVWAPLTGVISSLIHQLLVGCLWVGCVLGLASDPEPGPDHVDFGLPWQKWRTRSVASHVFYGPRELWASCFQWHQLITPWSQFPSSVRWQCWQLWKRMSMTSSMSH